MLFILRIYGLKGDGRIQKITRCHWAERNSALKDYHDNEWGVPIFDEQRLFAALSLEIFQAGLQWTLILKKRPAIYHAFNDFDYHKIAKYSAKQLSVLLRDQSIIRNRAKITAIINNAKALIKLHRKGLTLQKLTWQNVNNVSLDHLLIDSKVKVDYSRFIEPFMVEFNYYGFKRIGPKTLYSYLQAVGVINDHAIRCFRHSEISKIFR